MSDSAGEPSAPSRLVHLPETDSTNAEAMRRALAGEAPPLWVLADRQTAGRGRAGRAWASQPGNLFASLLVSTSCPPALAGQLSLVAGVAAIDAIRRAAGQAPPAGLRLKWPNDILDRHCQDRRHSRREHHPELGGRAPCHHRYRA